MPKKTSLEAAERGKEHKRERPEFRVRLMKPEDVSHCLKIFREHELPELSDGLSTYRTLDPDGCWVVEDITNGECSV